MPKVVPIREQDDASELVPHVKADVEFYCYELRVGDELHRKHRSGTLRTFKVRGFRKGDRTARPAAHNARVHPKDTVLLKEIGVKGGHYEVNALYVELSTRWGLVRGDD
jgi:hypothetical protein